MDFDEVLLASSGEDVPGKVRREGQQALSTVQFVDLRRVVRCYCMVLCGAPAAQRFSYVLRVDLSTEINRNNLERIYF